MEKPQHVPVLLDESLEFLNVHPGATVCDATLGLGGHSAAIARRLGGAGTLICFDRDPEAMAAAQEKLNALGQELGSEMPTVRYVPRAFSSIAATKIFFSSPGIAATISFQPFASRIDWPFLRPHGVSIRRSNRSCFSRIAREEI